MMNCARIQQELMLLFGSGDLPEEIRLHLDSCPECRDFAAELEAVQKRLGDDEDFFPNDSEVETLAISVDAAIDEIESRKVVPSKVVPSKIVSVAASQNLFRTKYLATAAAVVLALGTYLVGQFSIDMAPPSAGYEDDSYFSTVWSETDEEQYEPNDPAVRMLISDYAETARLSGTDELLSDITEEEYDYMMKNFDIGDLL